MLEFFCPEDFASLSFISHIISRLKRETKISACFLIFFRGNSPLPSKGIDTVDHDSTWRHLFCFLFHTTLLGTSVEMR